MILPSRLQATGSPCLTRHGYTIITTMWYVYVLVSDKKKDWHYYGYSADLKRRFAQHFSGVVASTRPYLPLHLKYYEAYDTENAAKHREKTLKASRSATKALHGRIYGAGT